jgi:hypothetical protein
MKLPYLLFAASLIPPLAAQSANQPVTGAPKLPTATDSVSVTTDINAIDLLSPDPAEKVFVRQDLLDANPGRPGAPISIPGYPIETASSGIKAPQYFAPGVAGDHGEPIAQYIAVGSYLLPNNLSANAHGNGYADPNIFIPQILASVEVEGGAFNVREGNHSLNLAATYSLRRTLDPFVTLTGDTRDLDLIAAIAPTPNSWVAIELSYGNGFLARLEHRQQYKLNAQRVYRVNRQQLTLLGMAYYAFSYVPGLVPLFAPSPADAASLGFPGQTDTIDPRQKGQTHTTIAAFNDVITLTPAQQLSVSGFFRTYNLALFSNFGQGLIRQSEFRTVAGQSTDYINKLSESFSLLAGFDYNREAPRRDNLDHYANYTGSLADGPFTKVDSSNITLASYTPYAAAAGSLSPFVRYYAGWRRDQIQLVNEDLVNSQNSSNLWSGINSPKATVSFLPKPAWHAPTLAASFGQAFFTEDPRIGLGDSSGTAVARAHSYQFVATETLFATDLKLTIGHVTTGQELGKIDPDTGLQQSQGPGRLRFLTVAARHDFRASSLLLTVSKADARDVDTGLPTPEAPRTLFDLLGSTQHLPLKLRAKAEFEYVGRKPLGTGCEPNLNAECTGTSVRELRAQFARPFLQQRLTLGLNALLAGGYSGQTIENFGASPIQEAVGVRIPSYASLSLTYRFAPTSRP